MRRRCLAFAFLALAVIACASRPSAAAANAPTDAELADLVRRLATMPGRIIPAGSVYQFEADTLLTRPIAAADVRAVPLLVDCLGDTTASEVGLHRTGEYVVTVAAVCFQVLLDTEFYQTRARANAWPAGFDPFVSYDAPPETWLAAQAAWKTYLATQREVSHPIRPSYNYLLHLSAAMSKEAITSEPLQVQLRRRAVARLLEVARR